MTYISIIALIIVVVTVNLLIKRDNPSISLMVSISLCLVIVVVSVNRLSILVELMNELSENVTVDISYVKVVLKMLGISYVSEFASSISREAGQLAVSNEIEIMGKLTILAVGLPVLLAVVNTVLEMIG